ncbi:hypothetical protein BKN38_02860 [Helicobacter sp. CLO-3]|uniref:hypothetical protein n=1 Tax=unclassified Helicobacter TaxID=2593540 RepID=UPI00080594A4|nr:MULTISPECIES: hypothetical protein [unclassified Helicobacter]OBV29553.1 hypothetical protein BA723_05030 [Helicobacter sp. CLO-3]OHU84540.1 hypothetical protein BKN38_02860 [Helicobacter sp. CLO-3]
MQNSVSMMKNSTSIMKKVLFVTLSLALASFAYGDDIADDKSSNSYYDYILGFSSWDSDMMKDRRFVEEGEKRWLEFGFKRCILHGDEIFREDLDLLCTKRERESYEFGKEYFRPIWYSEYEENGKKYFQTICFDNAAERFCQYALKKPLKLKGELIFSTDYSVDACDEAIHVSFKADDMSVATDLFNIGNVDFERDAQTYEMIKSQIPQWYLDGLAGEVGFEVELEVATRTDALNFWSLEYSVNLDYSACGGYGLLMTKNLKILRKIDEKMFDKDKYGDEGSNEFIPNFKVKLDTTDDFVNLRQSPNGKILAKIYKKDFDSSAVFNLTYGEYATPDNYYKNDLQANIQDMIGKPRGERPEELDPKKPRWIKVVYFPPNVTKAEQAIVGYIHNSQMKKTTGVIRSNDAK